MVQLEGNSMLWNDNVAKLDVTIDDKIVKGVILDGGLGVNVILKEMDRIILNHIQIEDHILFPMLL